MEIVANFRCCLSFKPHFLEKPVETVFFRSDGENHDQSCKRESLLIQMVCLKGEYKINI